MVILNRKRIILVITSVFISVFCFMFYSSENSKTSVQTVSLPVSNKVVVIDARTWNTR